MARTSKSRKSSSSAAAAVEEAPVVEAAAPITEPVAETPPAAEKTSR